MLPVRETSSDLSTRFRAFRRTHPYREVNASGTTWRYLTGGKVGPAVLLLPGELRSPEPFFALMESLESDGRVVAPAYPAVPTVTDLVVGAVATMDAEGISRFAVLGTGFGGCVAQCLVRRYPQKVDRLVLANTGLSRSSVPAEAQQLAAAGMGLLPEQLVRRITRRMWLQQISARTPDAGFWMELLQELAGKVHKDDIASQFAELADFGACHSLQRADLAAWPGRVLIVESEGDAAYGPKAQAQLRATYPRAQVHRFPATAGAPLFDRPDEFISVVQQFLA